MRSLQRNEDDDRDKLGRLSWKKDAACRSQTDEEGKTW